MSNHPVLLTCLLLAPSISCSDSIDSTGQDQTLVAGSLIPVTNGDGTLILAVDATHREEWTRVHLDDGVVSVGEPWDLAFRRFSVRINGGGSGVGFGAGQYSEATDIQAVDGAPDNGWEADGQDAAELVLSEWYAYDNDTHKLTAVPGSWLIRGVDGQRYYALEINSYYDAAGDSGVYRIRWLPLAPPENTSDLTPGTGALPTPTDNPQSGSMDQDDMDGDAGRPPSASFGCYSGSPDHTCDCEVTQENCDETNGAWTEQCACDD